MNKILNRLEKIQFMPNLSLLFQSDHQPYLGLDIEPLSSTLVQLEGSLSKPRLTSLSFSATSRQAMKNELVSNPSELANDLQSLLESANTNYVTTAIAAPSNIILMKQVAVSKTGDDEANEQLIWAEAEKVFPSIMNDLFIDFIKAGDTRTNHQIQLIAARKKDMQPRINAAKMAGLNIRLVDIDYYALERTYPLIAPQLNKDHAKQYIAIINMDSTAILMTVIHQQKMVYNTCQTYNGDILRAMVKLKLGLKEETPEKEDNQLSDTQKELIITKVKRILQSFIAEHKDETIEQIVLCGRIAVLPKIDTIIETALEIPTILANPFATMDVDSTVQLNDHTAPIFMLSCGLALRGLTAHGMA